MKDTARSTPIATDEAFYTALGNLTMTAIRAIYVEAEASRVEQAEMVTDRE